MWGARLSFQTLTPTLKLTNPVPLEEELRATTSIGHPSGGLRPCSRYLPHSPYLSRLPLETPCLTMRCGEGGLYSLPEGPYLHERILSVDKIPLSHIAWSLATAQFGTDLHMGLLCVPLFAADHPLEMPFLHRRSHQ